MGCGVWGSGFGVWGVGFGVWGVGCGVWGVGYAEECEELGVELNFQRLTFEGRGCDSGFSAT